MIKLLGIKLGDTPTRLSLSRQTRNMLEVLSEREVEPIKPVSCHPPLDLADDLWNPPVAMLSRIPDQLGVVSCRQELDRSQDEAGWDLCPPFHRLTIHLLVASHNQSTLANLPRDPLIPT